MNATEYGQDFMWDLNTADLLKARSEQDDLGILGASSFGCREQMRRVLTHAPKTDSPSKLPALIGSYVDAGVKAARALANPRLLLAEEWPCVMPNGHKIMVHPDEIDQDEPAATDVKTKAGLAAIRRGFSDIRYRRQRHIQYFAGVQNGLLPPEGTVRNIYLDRSGKDPDPHVEQEPFDMAVVEEASAFLDDVLYAVDHDETAEKDTPRHLCELSCAWFTACRGGEIQTDKIADEDTAARITAYYEAKQRIKADEALVEALRNEGLEGLTGVTATHKIVSLHVNPVDKTPYTKITVTPL